MPQTLFNRSLLQVSLSILFAILFTGAATAQSLTYTVEDVFLDKTASNAVEAKDLAIVEGQRNAFETLAARLLMEVPKSRIDQMSDLEISTLINDFETNNEKFSTTRYQANMTVRFNERAVKRILSGYGKMQVASEAKDSLLVLPILKADDGSTLLWSENNDWLKTWQAMPARSGLVPLAIPVGGTSDRALVNETLIMTSDKTEVEYLLKKYNAQDVLIPIFSRTKHGGTVELYSYVGNDLALLETREVAVMDTTSEDIIYRAAVDAVKQYIDDDWKNRQKYSDEFVSNQAELKIYFDSMRDWIEIQRTLLNLPEVSRMDVKTLKRDFALVMADLTVPPQTLQGKLPGLGFEMNLSRQATGYGAASLPPQYEVKKGFTQTGYGDPYYNQNTDDSVVYDTTVPDAPIVQPMDRLPDQPSLTQGTTRVEGSYQYIYRPQQDRNNKRWDNTYERP